MQETSWALVKWRPRLWISDIKLRNHPYIFCACWTHYLSMLDIITKYVKHSMISLFIEWNHIYLYVKHCQVCQCNDKTFILPATQHPSENGILCSGHSVDKSRHWHRWPIRAYFTDLIDRWFFVTIIDYCSKFPEVLLTDKTTSTSFLLSNSLRKFSLDTETLTNLRPRI